MQLRKAICPRCHDAFVVSAPLWEIGTVRLRCPACTHYFLPEGSPASGTPERAANANVPIEIWEPAVEES
jgi:rRNA maturation protein Nop10